MPGGIAPVLLLGVGAYAVYKATEGGSSKASAAPGEAPLGSTFPDQASNTVGYLPDLNGDGIVDAADQLLAETLPGLPSGTPGVPGTSLPDDVAGISPFDQAYLDILAQNEQRLTDEAIRLANEQAANTAAADDQFLKDQQAAADAYQDEFARSNAALEQQGNLGNALFIGLTAIEVGRLGYAGVQKYRGRGAAKAARVMVDPPATRGGPAIEAPRGARASARPSRVSVSSRVPDPRFPLPEGQVRAPAARTTSIRTPSSALRAEARLGGNLAREASAATRAAARPGLFRTAANVIGGPAVRAAPRLAAVAPVARLAARAAVPIAVGIGAVQERHNIATLASTLAPGGRDLQSEAQRGTATYEASRSIARTGTDIATLGLVRYDPGAGGLFGSVEAGSTVQLAQDIGRGTVNVARNVGSSAVRTGRRLGRRLDPRNW